MNASRPASTRSGRTSNESTDQKIQNVIRSDEVFKIGYIRGARGLRGEVEMAFTDDCFDTGTAEYLVLDMDGILVPFFWEEYRFKRDDVAIVKFEDIDTQERAAHLAGRAVFYPKDALAEPEEGEGATLSSYKQLTGYTIYNKESLLGTVDHVDDSSANVLLTISRADGGECIVPFHNDFLIDFNLRERTLVLELPEGLLELNE